MNYKNLVFTALMAVNFMSHGAEPKPQSASSWSLWSASNWALGGITAGMSVKCAYHLIKAVDHLYKRQNNRLQSFDIIKTHNQKVIDKASYVPDINAIATTINDAGVLIPALANIAAEYAHAGPTSDWKTSEKKLIRQGLFILDGDQNVQYSEYLSKNNRKFVLLDDEIELDLKKERSTVKQQAVSLSKFAEENQLQSHEHNKKLSTTLGLTLIPGTVLGASAFISKLLSNRAKV